MQKVKVTNEKLLQEEVNRLKKRSRKLEFELSGRVEYFKGNYGKMAFNSVVPGSARNSGVLSMVGRVAKIALQSTKFKSFTTSAIMTALEFAGVRMGINLFDKFRHRRKKKRARAAAKEEKEDY